MMRRVCHPHTPSEAWQKAFKTFSCSIELDNDQESYFPGDTILGSCLIKVEEKLQVGGMAVVVKGYYTSHHEASSQVKGTFLAGRQGPSSNSMCVVAPGSWILEPKADFVEAGRILKQMYTVHENQKVVDSFRIELPDWIPPSHKDNLCSVYYEMSFYVSMLDAVYARAVRKLRIRPKLNLALQPTLKDPLLFSRCDGNIMYTFKKNQRLKFTFETARQGLVAGQRVPFQMVVYNPERKAVKEVSVELNRTTEYVVNFQSWDLKKVHQIVAKAEMALDDRSRSSEEMRWDVSNGAFLDVPKRIVHTQSTQKLWYFGDIRKVLWHSYQLKVGVFLEDRTKILETVPVILGTEWGQNDSAKFAGRLTRSSSIVTLNFDTDKMESQLLPSYSMLSLLSLETLPPTYEQAMKEASRNQSSPTTDGEGARTSSTSTSLKFSISTYEKKRWT